ncbi:MAG: DUF503 family protein [Saccharofermentanales bacterium]
MRILVIEAVLDLPWCRSLKDKRRQRQRLIDRIVHTHKVSVKEVDAHDVWQTLILGMAAVVLSEDGGHALAQSLYDLVCQNLNGEIRTWHVEIL